jgi:hypothetical protein
MFFMMRFRMFVVGQYGLVAAVVLAALWILWTELRPPVTAAAGQRRAVAVSITSLHGAGTTIGPFRLVSAAALASPEKSFGGLSGLAALADGRLLAITDAGDWVMMRPGAATAEMGSISMPGGDPGAIKADRDAEAIAFTPDGHTLISLEQQHRTLRFAGHGPPLNSAGEPLYRTDTMAWPPNGGGESLAVLGDGSLVWIAENSPTKDGALAALLVVPGGRTRRILIGAVSGFSPTDAAVLDDTHLLVLHRRYTGLETAAAISLVDLAPVLAGGSAAPGRVLARWERGGAWPVDNMEGIAIVRRAGKLPMLYLVSDDNFSAAQRTLLLQLEVTAPLK